MPASIRNLHVLGYAGGFTAWLYKAPTTPIGDMDQPGYFDAMADMMTYGDALTMVGIDGVAMRYVRSAGGGTVVLGVM